MRTLIVLPARLNSTRLVEKPLQVLGGISLIRRAAQEAVKMKIPNADVVVATDSGVVAAEVRGVCPVIFTTTRPKNGTERVAEAVLRDGTSEARHWDVEMIVNLQPDQLFVDRRLVLGAITMAKRFEVGTAGVALTPEVRAGEGRVKVFVGPFGTAVGFTRTSADSDAWNARLQYYSRVHSTAWQHVGVYAYRPDALRRWVNEASTHSERKYGLEQLRPLFWNMDVGVYTSSIVAPGVVDTAADLAAAEKRFEWVRPLCP